MRDKKSFMQIALTPTRELEGAPPPLVPFADWDYYYLKDKLEWHSDADPSIRVTVPVGFVTDLASVPRVFWSLLPPTARFSYPAIIHDYLYWLQMKPFDERAAADKVLKEAMEDLKVGSAQVFAVYNAVSLAGGHAWTSNGEARAAGERRVLKRFPTDFKTTWEQWKKEPDVFA